MEFQLRDKIDNQYRVTEKYYGGMSVVYIVLDEFSQRRFAVKTVKEEYIPDRTVVERFAIEARTWMNIGRHDNVVEAIIYREINNQPFLFLEYIEGTELQRLLNEEKRLFPPQALRFMLQVCDGMEHIHRARISSTQTGVIHRDLKPSNLMITREARIKITDFGLAKVHGAPTHLTDSGVGLGTYYYMPPEQVLDASSADRTSDVYSFGVVFFLALAGKMPLSGKNVGQLLRNILSEEPLSLGRFVEDIPAELEALIGRCLAKSREQRFPNFEELRAEIVKLQPIVENTYAARDDVLRCIGCEYETIHPYRSCPICARSLNPREKTVVAAVTETPAVSSPPFAALPSVDLESDRPAAETQHISTTSIGIEVNELIDKAVELRKKGDLRRALAFIKRALALQPDNGKIRVQFDEVAAEMTRQRTRQNLRAYNWPLFRGNITRTGITPEEVTPPLARRWNQKVGDWLLASPVVSNGILYIGGHLDRPTLQGCFSAINARNGEPKWKLDFQHPLVLSACVLGGNVIFVACHNRLHALDAKTGGRLWETSVSEVITTPPVAWQNMLFVATEGGALHALEAQSGRRLWHFSRDAAMYSPPLAWEGRVYLGACDHRLYALSQTDGAVEWEFVAANEINTCPAFHRGRIYLGSVDRRVYCIDAEKGRRVWEFKTEAAVNSSPAVFQDTVFIGSRDHNLYALDAETGRFRWNFSAGDWIDSSPAVSSGTVYFGSHDRRFYAIDSETGTLLWDFQTEGEISSSPAISAGHVFIAANDVNLFAFRPH